MDYRRWRLLIDTIFPEQLILVIATAIGTIDGVSEVKQAPLASVDQNGAAAVFCPEIIPGIVEMDGSLSLEPTFKSYMLLVQHLVKHSSREDGYRIHSNVAKSIGLMLYRDQSLQVALRALVENLGPIERFKDIRLGPQRFASNDIDGMANFLSVTDVIVTTETL